MLCLKPYRQGVSEYGCGQCLPCRFNRRRLWTARLMLESRLHAESCFVTLTYGEDHVPVDGSVDVRVAQLFVKRVRDRVYPAKLRYFIVGEYGDRSGRPHYHAILFGVCDRELIAECWPFGFVHVGTLTEASCGYTVSYVVKGWNREREELKGRRPEFARMSLKPGIGAGSVDGIADVMTSRGGAKFVVETGDVAACFRADGKKYPLGRYLRARVRESIGMEPGQSDRARRAGVERKCIELNVPGAVEKLDRWRLRYGNESKRQHSRYKAAHLKGIVKGRI